MPSRAWKCISDLTWDDFKRHPLWGFDLERGEADPDADETFVRPHSSTEALRQGDSLFLKAKIQRADDTALPGAVCINRLAGKPEVEALMILEPVRLHFYIDGDEISHAERWQLRKDHADVLRTWFPITYRATLRVRKRRLTLEGKVEG